MRPRKKGNPLSTSVFQRLVCKLISSRTQSFCYRTASEVVHLQFVDKMAEKDTVERTKDARHQLKHLLRSRKCFASAYQCWPCDQDIITIVQPYKKAQMYICK